MSTAIASRRRLPLAGIGPFIIAAARAISKRIRAARRRREAAAQLENLPDRLRQDIGLADSSPSAAELIKRFHLARRPLPREHENRFKLWV
jgi:hypothetical protein